jgi:hypothetical protein
LSLRNILIASKICRSLCMLPCGRVRWCQAVVVTPDCRLQTPADTFTHNSKFTAVE